MSRACGILALLAVLSACAPVWAQHSQHSYADRELNKIRAQTLGRENTVSGVNNVELSRTRGRGVPNVGQGTAGTPSPGLRYTAANIGTGSAHAGHISKPFANVRPTPTVSPYLNLFREDLD